MQIRGAHAEQFRDAHAGGVQQLDERAIAEAAGRCHVRLGDERVDFLDREKLRQRRPRARPLQVVGRALLQPAVEHQKAEEATNRGDRPRHRPGRQPARHLLPDERLEGGPVERFRRDSDVSAANAASALRSRW